jgi:hypothetical protein
MKRLLAVAIALALPAGAIAKEPVAAKVCGADGCTVSKDKEVIVPLLEGGPPTGKAPDAGAPSYKVVITIAEGNRRIDTFATWHVPSLRLIRNADGVWMPMPAAAYAALRTITRDLQPYPAERLGLPVPVPKPTSGVEAGDDVPWWLLTGAAAMLAALGAGLFRHTRRRSAAVS